MIAALSSAVQEEMDKSKVQSKVLYTEWYPFFKIRDGLSLLLALMNNGSRRTVYQRFAK